ncbi:uncharacterized protein V3H82_019418 isoform 2-T2 [Fundulus diaphanus]
MDPSAKKSRKEEFTPLRTMNLLRSNGIKGPEFLAWVSENISTYRYKRFSLESPVGAMLTIAPLEDTEYSDRPAVVNAWGKFYLPITVTMQVIGYVTGTSYPCDQLVLMTCEDQKVYGYDGDELHLLASSPKQLSEEGIACPPSKSYYHGEALKDMTSEDWEKVKQSPVGKRLDEEHHNLVASHKSTLLKNLRLSRKKQSLHQQYGRCLPHDVLTQLQKGGT